MSLEKNYKYFVMCQSFTYLEKNRFEYCWAKSKNMTKILTFHKFNCVGAVG